MDRKQHEGDVNCVRCWQGEGIQRLLSVGDDEKIMIWNVRLSK